MSLGWLGGSLTAAVLFSFPLQGHASINFAGTLLTPATSVPQRCSGAFRYAARDGNSDISPVSPAQVIAKDRYIARTRYSALAMSGLDTERSRLHLLSAICGAR